jgi:hypothetical protein
MVLHNLFRDRQPLLPDSPLNWAWPFWPLVPIYPYGQRRTLRREIVPDTIWSFEQVQGIFYVAVPIRMTVVRLDAGGLLVYAPVAPTGECIALMRELEAVHGAVKYIILPTVSGLEHKVFVGPFARKFPQAQVYVAPDQWSFPVPLPLTWLGLPGNRTQRLPLDKSQVPFVNEVDYEILGPIGLGLGPFEEVALFHRRSQTLLLTDTLVSVPDTPPAIVRLDPYPLLFHARDTVRDAIEDTEANQRRGWHRVALFAFYFRPAALDTIPLPDAIQNARYARDRSRKAYYGVYPFRWKPGWEQSFEYLRGYGRPFVAPILQTLILNRDPQAVLDWLHRIGQWNIRQIIPCHLDAPITAGVDQIRQAFRFIEEPWRKGFPTCLPAEDMELLRDLDKTLTARGITPPTNSSSEF